MVRGSLLKISEREASNGLYAAWKACAKNSGREFEFDASTKEHIVAAAKWIVDEKGKNGLMMCGLTGNGKTALATSISWLVEKVTEDVDGYSKRKWFVMITAKNLSKLIGKPEFDRYAAEPLLTIDDLGEEAADVMTYGNYATPMVDIISERYAKRLRTIVTTNLQPKQLRERYGERVYDRMKEMFEIILFKNPSYRR